ncbi:MAG: outer membrane beta-barrel protein [Rickettsiales bacterium]|jgi:opacity protein-like surface antigen|nr:outer membrane beta-barrel protein [Rickettsiales bacterium]
MKKLAIISLFIFAPFAARAWYISDKLSFSRLNILDKSLIIYDTYSQKSETSKINNMFINRLAGGFNLPVESLQGAIRGEIELGLASSTKTKSKGVIYDTSSFKYSNESKFKVKPTFFILNAYYDFNTSTKFIPYAGIGIGAVHYQIESSSNASELPSEGTQIYFVWNISIGTSYSLTDRFALDASYRYSDFMKSMVGTYAYYKNSHELSLGARYAF